MSAASGVPDAAALWDARYAAATTAVWHLDPNMWVREAVEGRTPGHALDVAAGEGRHALWLAGLGWQVDAVDISAVGLARGRALAAEAALSGRITWTVADVVTTPPARTYDLVVVAHLHLPAEPLAEVLRSAVAALDDGGLLVVVGHDAANLTDGVGGPRDPQVLYGPDDVVTHLDGTGVRVTHAQTRARPVAGADRPALDAVVVAVRQA